MAIIKLKTHLIILFIFLIPIFLTGQNSANIYDHYLVKTWTTENGLPQNTINAIVKSPVGYIWIGTDAGLTRFDGMNFKTFTKINTPIITNDRILALHVDNQKIIWRTK